MKRLLALTPLLLAGTCPPAQVGTCPKPIMQLWDRDDTSLKFDVAAPIGLICKPIITVGRPSQPAFAAFDVPFQATIWGNVADVTGLVASQEYTFTAYARDPKGVPTYGATLTCKTDGADGGASPKVYGISPAALRDDGFFSIAGSGFAALGNVIKVDQIRARDCQYTELIASTFGADSDTRITASLQYSTVPDRYIINLPRAREVQREAAIINTIPFGTPRGEYIVTSVTKWEPAAWCLYLKERACVCGGSDRYEEQTRAYLGKELDPNDGWNQTRWWNFDPVMKNAARDWTTVCSEAWQPNKFARIGGITLPREPVTLQSYQRAALNIRSDSIYLGYLARGLREQACVGALVDVPGVWTPWTSCAPEGGTPDFCTQTSWSVISSSNGSSSGGVRNPLTFKVPTDCWKYAASVIARGNEIHVDRVLVLLDGVFEVPPSVMKGICNPQSIYADTNGLCIISDNRVVGSRWDQQTGFFEDHQISIRRDFEDGSWVIGDVVAPCADHWKDPTHPINKDYWEIFNDSEAPSRLAERMVKPLTGGTTGSPPTYSIAVEFPTTSNPRGFGGAFGGRSASDNCTRAVDGFVNDYTTSTVLDDVFE